MVSGMVNFNVDDALQYDENIARVLPGYNLMASVAVAHCYANLANYANILIVGAGTGNELAQLCQANPTWAFVAVEPADRMLVQAKQRCQNHHERIQWHHGTLDTLEVSEPFDTCLCLLVLHFFNDTDKEHLLRQIAEVNQGELLVSQRLLIENEEFLDSEIAHALLRGYPEEKCDFLRQRLLGFFAMSEQQALSLYKRCGFSEVRTLVQVLSYQLTRLQLR